MLNRRVLMRWAAGIFAMRECVQAQTTATPPAQPAGTLAVSVAASIAIAMCEFPAGKINGVNAVFTLSKPPMVNTQIVFRNGLALFPGCGDYQILGNRLTFQPHAIPQASDCLVVQYWAAP